MNQKTDDTQDSAEEVVPEAIKGEPVVETVDADLEKSEQTASEPGEGPPVDETVYGTRNRHVPPAGPPRRGISSVVAWLGLLLALLALASSGYLAWQNRASDEDEAGTEAAIAALSGKLDDTVSELQSRLQAALADLEEAARQRTARVGSLERELEEFARRNESVYPRLSNLEDAISSLQGISSGVRDTWMLAEAEYYMQIANAQLQLAGNPRIAALALQFADERIRQMLNPALGEVRRALTQELQALQSMEMPDIEGMTLTLANLAERTASLPLRQNVEVPDEEANPPVDPELTGLSRAVASIKRAFGDIVSVRRTDQPVTPLLAPDAAYFLRANLALQFQAARLALLKGEQQVFEQSLDDAADWLREYYDADSGAVASVLQTIGQLADSGVDITPPDISESLQLLRQYRTLQSAEPPATDDTDGGNDAGTDEPEQ